MTQFESKKIKSVFTLIVFLLGYLGMSQTMTIEQAMPGETQQEFVNRLVLDVLIGNPCADIDEMSISSRTGIDFGGGNPNGIAFFDYGNLSHSCDNGDTPFQSGVLIMSGDASQVGNTHLTTLSAGDQNWSGDNDLEQFTGLDRGQSANATVISFDFEPSANEFSFRFFMASEEYDVQNFECQFSDAFAFILTDSNGNQSNLAVLPGTNIPIQVTNIHQTLCPGETDLPIGSAFFCEEYDATSTSVFAFNGFTVPFTASAQVNPGETYNIKLVVADDGRFDPTNPGAIPDTVFDTGIFIQAGSFQGLDGSLPDFTVDSGNPGCGDTPVLLDTLEDRAGTTFQWYKEDPADPTNPTLIPGATDASYSVPATGMFGGSGEYTVVISIGGSGCTSEDSAVVEFIDQPIITSPPMDLFECDPDGDGRETFDLTENEPLVVGAQSNVLVQYVNVAGAIIGNPNVYTNATNPETITIRLSNNEDNPTRGFCPVEATFDISVFDAPTASDFDYILCDNDDDGDDTNGIVAFDLPSIDDEVLGTLDPTLFSVSYHLDQATAISGQSPLPDMYPNTSNNQQIFARVENVNNGGCFATSMVTLTVNPLPVINNSAELLQCDDDTDGITDFNLTEANELIVANPADFSFTYHNNLADADSGDSPITNDTAYPNTDPTSNPDVLFVRVENANGCHRVANLELFVSTTQIPPTFTIPTYQECDDTRVDDNITDGITVFDFSDATAQIEGLFPAGQNITVTYYENTADALAEANAIPDIANHINTVSPFNQTIIYRVDSDVDNECLGLGELQLETINPTPNTDPDDLVLCDDETIGDLEEVFNLRQNEMDIFAGNNNLTATYFTSMANALSDTDQIPNPDNYTNEQSPTQTIYVRVTDNTTMCFAVVDFDIIVNPLPDIAPIDDLRECENNTDEEFDFNIGALRDGILNGRDALDFEVTFHTSQFNADNLIDPLPDTFTNMVNPQELFVAITNTTTFCSNSTESFFVEVVEGAQANSDGESLDFELCDDNIIGDGVAQFDFSLIQDEILDGQTLAEVTLTYHETMDDALNTASPLPMLYENRTNPQTIYVRVSNNLNPDLCFEVQPIPLIVNPLPQFELEENYILCQTFNGSEVVPIPPVIDTGLSPVDYSFIWRLNGDILTGAIGPSLVPTQGGIYTVEAFDETTSTITRCSSGEIATEVIESGLPNLFDVNVTSEAFSGNNIIVAIASGNSTYEYSLDNGPWQTDGQFIDVSGGEHTVYVRDIFGCGVIEQNVTVIDYPRFFTPNGDGNNDTWNIKGIDTQPSSKIYIFDRYGKLLKQISPTSPGWDGTYQGNRMPTDDYWFTLEYREPLTGELKTQSSNFTLKR